MRRPSASLRLVLAVIMVALSGCGAGQSQASGAVPFIRVTLPPGVVPDALTTLDDALLIGVRDGPTPALLRLGPDSALADIAMTPSPRQSRWVSLTTDGDRIAAITRSRTDPRGDTSWSAWTGTDAGLTEHPSPSNLVDATLIPSGPALVGTWRGARAGRDITIWTQQGAEWTRTPSAATPLENTKSSLKTPLSATALHQGIAVAGWETTATRTRAAVWRSTYGPTDWTMTTLPSKGTRSAAYAIRCWKATCGATGHTDGRLTVWRLHEEAWTSAPTAPPIPIAASAHLTAPLEINGHLTQLITTRTGVTILQATTAGWTTLRASGPTGDITAATLVGQTLYILANRQLWQTIASSLTD